MQAEKESRWGARYSYQFVILLSRSIRTRRFQTLSTQSIAQFTIIGAGILRLANPFASILSLFVPSAISAVAVAVPAPIALYPRNHVAHPARTGDLVPFHNHCQLSVFRGITK